MHELYELKEKLMKELTEYASQEMSAGSLEVIDKLSHAIKNICKIIESAEEEGYSGQNSREAYSRDGYSRNYSRNGGRYAYEGGQGGSYARGRNAKRDSMGRYSRESNYSRTDGMEGLVDEIKSMMQELPQGLQQEAQRFVQKLEQEM